MQNLTGWLNLQIFPFSGKDDFIYFCFIPNHSVKSQPPLWLQTQLVKTISLVNYSCKQAVCTHLLSLQATQIFPMRHVMYHEFWQPLWPLVFSLNNLFNQTLQVPRTDLSCIAHFLSLATSPSLFCNSAFSCASLLCGSSSAASSSLLILLQVKLCSQGFTSSPHSFIAIQLSSLNH